MFVYNMIACLHRSSMPSVVQLPNTTKIVMINALPHLEHLVSSIQAIEFSTLYNTILHEKKVSKKLITTHFKMVGNVLGHELNYFVKHEIKDKKVLQRKCSHRMLQFLIDTSNVFVGFRGNIFQ